MIKRIDSTNYELVSDLLDRYRKTRNKDLEIHLLPEWVDLILEGFRTDRFYGLCYADNNGRCRGFLEYKLGKKSAFCSMIYSTRTGDRKKILTELARGLRNACPRRNILISEVSPGISADFQKEIFESEGFKQLIRYSMEFVADGNIPKGPRPKGIVFRKYSREMDSRIVNLDEKAYHGQVDEDVLKILTDIDNCAPSLRLVHTTPAIFESRLSSFAFRGEDLAGAVYCTGNGEELGIANIAIDPKFRRMGLGTALISRVLRGMIGYNYTNCVLMVSDGNHAAINLYKKFGFKLKRNCPIFVYHTGQGA